MQNTDISKMFFTLKVSYGLVADTTPQMARQVDGRVMHVRYFLFYFVTEPNYYVLFLKPLIYVFL